MLRNLILCTAVLLISSLTSAYDIRDFGAIADDDSLLAEQYNAAAFMDAIVAANVTTEVSERVVHVPYNYTFYTMPIWAANITNIVFQIDGTLRLSKRHHDFPLVKEGHIRDMFFFEDVDTLTVQGNGTVDGQGYMWWVREFIGMNKNNRPKLFWIQYGRNLHFTGVRWINSPKFHFELKDIDNLYMHDMEIHVDIKGQLELNRLFLGDKGWINADGKTLPTFPLNTDGIDPHGTNILIERVNITNFDDAVAIKPCHSKYQIATCSENIMVRDMNIWYGVGLSIGSVPANDKYNCVNNVTFSDSKFYHPLKAVYVKTNPGDTESMLPGSGGRITNVLYENLEIFRPIWWSIYIGPQQQNQPGPSDDPGCLLYPIVPCETQPRIDVHNITLRNVQQYGTLLPPGIIRCNSTNPCTGFVFDNVRAHGWWRLFGLNYIVENVEGVVTHSKPDPGFVSKQMATAGEQPFNFQALLERKVIPMVSSMLDNSYQAKINQRYRAALQSYTHVYSQFAR